MPHKAIVAIVTIFVWPFYALILTIHIDKQII